MACYHQMVNSIILRNSADKPESKGAKKDETYQSALSQLYE